MGFRDGTPGVWATLDAMTRALITGGTSGIGLAFATALAARGDDLVLVARDESRLAQVAASLARRFRVDVQTLSADLSDRDAVARVVSRLGDPSDPIEVCVNNAGFGLHARLLDDDVALQERAMDVMATDVLILSNAAARAMVARGSGTIINVASASAWIYTGNYSAIKRWVVSYTQALALELEGTGVQATVVCPGWVKTAFHERAGTDRPRLPGFVWVKAHEVARTALRDADRGKVTSVPTLKWRVALFVARHGPAFIPVKVSQMITRSRHKGSSDQRSDGDKPDLYGPRRAADSGPDEPGRS